jgi:hypothetical protein
MLYAIHEGPPVPNPMPPGNVPWLVPDELMLFALFNPSMFCMHMVFQYGKSMAVK